MSFTGELAITMHLIYRLSVSSRHIKSVFLNHQLQCQTIFTLCLSQFALVGAE